MADLSDKDKRSIFGPDYKEPEVTEAMRAQQRDAKKKSMLYSAMTIAGLAAVLLVAIYFGS